jgi:hypothetical protein
MVWTPNATPFYPLGPISSRVAVPATAKTVMNDASNTATLVAALANNRQTFNGVVAKPVASIAAGRLLLFDFDGGTTYIFLDDVAHGLQTVSTTAAGSDIVFPRFSKDVPLILLEGHALLIATAVAQTAGSLFAHAVGGKVW